MIIPDTFIRSYCIGRHRVKELQVQGDGRFVEMGCNVAFFLQRQSVWTGKGNRKI